MYIKVNQLKSDCFIGYAPNEESIKDWDGPPGYGHNRATSVGILANKTNNFQVYGGNDNGINDDDDEKQFVYHQISPNKQKQWDDGSILVISFDFSNDQLNIYLNQNKDPYGIINDHPSNDENVLLKSVSLNNHQTVIPAVSLNQAGDSVEVLKWRLY